MVSMACGDINLNIYQLEDSTPVTKPACSEPFNELELRERLYLHYLSRASWFGGLICYFQCSAESPAIYIILEHYFRDNKDAFTQPEGVSESDFNAFITYAMGIYANSGNYKSFGDTKFIPKCPPEAFEKILKSSPSFEKIEHLFSAVKERIFSLNKRELKLGLGESEGVSTYFSHNCEESDGDLTGKFLTANNISPENTRVMKTDDGVYRIVIASVDTDDDGSNLPFKLGPYEFEGKKFEVVRGDFAPLLDRVNENLTKALEYAANENEKKMLENYIESFKSGSVDKHIDGSRYWIKDKGPIIELYIGFIENYRDPGGIRAEFEGFVAMVNKSQSRQYAELVENAEKFIPLLPWPKEFEKDTFLRPDFTSLDIITYACSGIPAGINIPNYDIIRQNEGFKNVSLGNVISASAPNEKITFLNAGDAEIIRGWRSKAFSVQVALHELLGHGSGKLIMAGNSPAPKELTNPLTGTPVASWYEENETYSGKFARLGNPYEECRAECVGLFLGSNRDILKIFGYESDEDVEKVIYANWLSYMRQGLATLEFFDPEKKSWGQAHSEARFAIGQVVLEAGGDFMKVERIPNTDELGDDLIVTLDKSKIASVAHKAIETFLLKLQIYKATGDIATATTFFKGYSMPTEDFLAYRPIIIARKQPRKENVLPNTCLSEAGDQVTLKDYEASHKGMIQSFVDRFQDDPSLLKDMEDLWKKDSAYF